MNQRHRHRMVWPDRSPDPPPPQHIEYTQLAPPLNTHRLSKMRIRSMNLCPCRRSPNHSLRKMRTQPARRSPPGRLRTQLRERSLCPQNLPHSPHTLQSQLPSWKSPQRTPYSCWIRPRASLRSPRHRGMLRSRSMHPRRLCRHYRGTMCRTQTLQSKTCPGCTPRMPSSPRLRHIAPRHNLCKMRMQPPQRTCLRSRLYMASLERHPCPQNPPCTPRTLPSQLPSWKSPQRTPCSCWIRPRASLRSPRHRGMLRSRWPAPRRCRCPCRSRRGTTCRRPPRCSRTCPRRNSGTQSPHLRRGHTCRPRKLQEQQTAVKVVQNSADGRG